ncbi:MAG: arylamine N-acetyltransferase [Acidobacteriota bacterium]|nr:arylamine N-acetyltransferase [Acidobacteriota bacterium]
MEVETYLARIGYAGPKTPTLAMLRSLHRQHMLAVPFENLDIPLGRRITLDISALWAKVVVSKRGGFCYELNTLFGWLLHALGYDADVLSARVWTGTDFGPDKDHMALLVHAGGQPWLADVGFGDSFLEPLRLVPGTIQEDGLKSFRLLEDTSGWTMQVRERAGDWLPEYRFEVRAHRPESFAAMCDFQQTSPDSSFTQRAVCSRATEGGRVTVTHERLIVTTGDQRDETPLPDAAAFRDALAAHHGIDLTPEDAATIVGRFVRAVD